MFHKNETEVLKGMKPKILCATYILQSLRHKLLAAMKRGLEKYHVNHHFTNEKLLDRGTILGEMQLVTFSPIAIVRVCVSMRLSVCLIGGSEEKGLR